MEHETVDRPTVRRSRELQRERVEALLEEQRRREERVEMRRRRFGRTAETPGERTRGRATTLDS